MDQYATLMSQDLAHFPADILLEVVAALRRSSRFMPAVSEIYGPATVELDKRQRQLGLAEEHVQEHARRQAEEAEKADRQRQEDKQARRRLDRLNAYHWDDEKSGYSLADFKIAHRALRLAGLVAAVEWWVAVDGGERWAIELFPAALDAGRRIDAEGDRTAKMEAYEALKRAFENARAGAAA